MARRRPKGVSTLTSAKQAILQPQHKPFRAELLAVVPSLRVFARCWTRDWALADDLVQETVLRALSAADSFQPGSSMRAWCFTILRNFFLEQARKKKRESEVLHHYSEQQPRQEQTETVTDNPHDLEKFLWRLSPLLREALVLIGAQEMTYAEASKICGVEVSTMKVRVSRARSALRKIMDEQNAPAS
ncbi:sigma-70 family RNA polymerase sigma factor [Acetobacter vaccinii]|uniref:Sigma-70 family RNA polymerase sigma factor n=1 Tax=Acetobacter vaccinii TaxID=2592655 RepID=A0A5C1YTB3_9PROT|nr:sigma-70 family RNA polymerase sigma factor [Acetobacter vaccinii]QEO18267.1 sigma-70 family RNA polymerase sigma factor [Acetobacter vaccinii]